jgi:hypothetical protein
VKFTATSLKVTDSIFYFWHVQVSSLWLFFKISFIHMCI